MDVNRYSSNGNLSCSVEKSSASEPTMVQLGFHPDTTRWDEILQPKKTDLLVLIENIIKNNEQPTVEITVADSVFHVHMIVLQCYSRFFKDLPNPPAVVLPADQVTPRAFEMIYEWMLGAESRVGRDGIIGLFKAARYLRIKELMDQCWACMDSTENFVEDTAFLLYMEARAFGEPLVQELMLSRISRFFLTLVATKEFLELDEAEVRALLGSNAIAVNAETEVFFAVIRWVCVDWDAREQHLLPLMNCVRFGLFPPWQLVELMRTPNCGEVERVMAFPEVMRMAQEGLYFVVSKQTYGNRVEALYDIMERMKLGEPNERRWVVDKTIRREPDCPNYWHSTYGKFLEYLELIRKAGTEHWQSLIFTERCYSGGKMDLDAFERIRNDLEEKISHRSMTTAANLPSME